MKRRLVLTGWMLCVGLAALCWTPSSAQAQGGVGQPSDWGRFYHYPYVYYPDNFGRPQQFNSLYHRYPSQRRIPVYNKAWHNEYTSPRPYHMGHHFILDVF